MDAFQRELMRRSPLAACVLEACDFVFDAELLDSVWRAHRGRCYEDVLGFAFVSEVVVPADKSVQAAMHAHGYTVVRLQTPYGERIKLLAPAQPAAAEPAPGYILDKANATYLTFIVDDIQAVVDAVLAPDLALADVDAFVGG